MSILDKRTEIMNTALELIQSRGYNGFSFHHLSKRVGIRTASIHYHFPTKGDLGLALVKRQRKELADYFLILQNEVISPWERLEKYIDLFRSTFENGSRMCLGGMLALESQTLPEDLVSEVRAYFEDNETWLTRTLLSARKAQLIELSRPATEVARSLFGALEGALLSACAFGDIERFNAAAAWYINHLRH